jgi:hypothetical protein
MEQQPEQRATDGVRRKKYNGMALGIALGVVFGMTLGNIGVGLALGVALGAAFDEKQAIHDTSVTGSQPE